MRGAEGRSEENPSGSLVRRLPREARILGGSAAGTGLLFGGITVAPTVGPDLLHLGGAAIGAVTTPAGIAVSAGLAVGAGLAGVVGHTSPYRGQERYGASHWDWKAYDHPDNIVPGTRNREGGLVKQWCEHNPLTAPRFPIPGVADSRSRMRRVGVSVLCGAAGVAAVAAGFDVSHAFAGADIALDVAMAGLAVGAVPAAASLIRRSRTQALGG